MTKRFGVAANALGVACIVIALVKRDDVTIEGAYFNRSVGAPAYEGVFISGPSIVPWLVAAALLVVAGTALLLRQRR